MRPTLLAALTSSLLLSSAAAGDALALLQSDTSFEPEPPAAAEAPSNWYARAEVGVNLMDNLDPKSALGQFHMHPGLDVGASVGYYFTETIAVEAQAGVSWNRFKEWTQGTKPAIDATGDFIQVPLVANIVFRIPLTNEGLEPIFGEDAELLLYAGGGGQYANGTMNAEGADIFTADGWTFRYQVGAALNAQFTDTMKFGLYFRFARSGSLDASQPLGADISFSSLTNYAVGMNLSLKF